MKAIRKLEVCPLQLEYAFSKARAVGGDCQQDRGAWGLFNLHSVFVRLMNTCPDVGTREREPTQHHLLSCLSLEDHRGGQQDSSR